MPEEPTDYDNLEQIELFLQAKLTDLDRERERLVTILNAKRDALWETLKYVQDRKAALATTMRADPPQPSEKS